MNLINLAIFRFLEPEKRQNRLNILFHKSNPKDFKLFFSLYKKDWVSDDEKMSIVKFFENFVKENNAVIDKRKDLIVKKYLNKIVDINRRIVDINRRNYWKINEQKIVKNKKRLEKHILSKNTQELDSFILNDLQSDYRKCSELLMPFIVGDNEIGRKNAFMYWLAIDGFLEKKYRDCKYQYSKIKAKDPKTEKIDNPIIFLHYLWQYIGSLEPDLAAKYFFKITHYDNIYHSFDYVNWFSESNKYKKEAISKIPSSSLAKEIVNVSINDRESMKNIISWTIFRSQIDNNPEAIRALLNLLKFHDNFFSNAIGLLDVLSELGDSTDIELMNYFFLNRPKNADDSEIYRLKLNIIKLSLRSGIEVSIMDLFGALVEINKQEIPTIDSDSSFRGDFYHKRKFRDIKELFDKYVKLIDMESLFFSSTLRYWGKAFYSEYSGYPGTSEPIRSSEFRSYSDAYNELKKRDRKKLLKLIFDKLKVGNRYEKLISLNLIIDCFEYNKNINEIVDIIVSFLKDENLNEKAAETLYKINWKPKNIEEKKLFEIVVEKMYKKNINEYTKAYLKYKNEL